MDNLAEILQVKIRDTGQTNNEFAKTAKIKKKELDAILSGIAPDNWVLGKICSALEWDYEPEPSHPAHSPKVPEKIQRVKADFTEKPKSPLRAKGRFCIRCHFRKGIYTYDIVEMAHYTGQMQAALGKGRGEKVSDILKTPFCKKCHKYFDEPEEYKSTDLSEEFLFYIALFISQEFEKRNIIILKNND